MKKLTFFITILILLSVSLFSETGNFYWYRTSEDTANASVSVFRKNNPVILVLSGQHGVFTSEDGLNWIRREVGYEVDGTYYYAKYIQAISGNSECFTAGGDWGAAGLTYSADGTIWETKRLENANMHDIVWSEEKGIFVAVAGPEDDDDDDDEYGQGSIRVSVDGKNWEDVKLENGYYPGYAINGVAYGNGKFVAVGEERIYTSTTGYQWKQSNYISFGDNDVPNAITFGNGKFIVVGNDAIYSLNGTEDAKIMANWTKRYGLSRNGLSNPFYDIEWNGQIFIAVGSRHGNEKPILISNDGISWSEADIDTTEKLFRSVTWSSDLNAFFAVSKNPSTGSRGRVFRSNADGAEWEDLTEQMIIKDESGNRLFKNNIDSIRLETIYARSIFIEPEEPLMQFDATIFATTEGGNFSNPAIKITGSSRIIGSVGTNSVGTQAVVLDSWPSPRNIIDGPLSIGSGGFIEDVIYVSGWEVKPEDVVTGSIGDLPEKRIYPIVNFPDFPELPKREDFSTPSTEDLYYEISEDGQYNNIVTSSSRVLTIDLNEGTRKIRVKNLSISGDVVLKNIGENGRLILYVEDTFTISGGRKFNYPDGEKDHKLLTVFYAGNNDLSFGQSSLAGDLISKTAKIVIGHGNIVIGNIISESGDITIEGAANSFGGIVYTPNGDVELKASGTSGIIVGRTIECTGNVSGIENKDVLDEFPYELFE